MKRWPKLEKRIKIPVPVLQEAIEIIQTAHKKRNRHHEEVLHLLPKGEYIYVGSEMKPFPVGTGTSSLKKSEKPWPIGRQPFLLKTKKFVR